MFKSFIVLILCFINVLANQSIEKEINLLLNKVPKSTIAAIQITKASNNKVIYKHNSTTVVIPASTTKLFTTAVALTTFGEKYKFTTKLFTDDDNLKDGVIDGNLYIKGFGNSMFSENDLDDYVAELKRLGIKKITGKIIADDSYLDNLYSREDWIEDEVDNVPLPPISALALNENKMIVSFSSGKKKGGLLEVHVFPLNKFVKIQNSATAADGKRKPRVKLSFDGKNYIVNVSGTLRRNFSTGISVKVENPSFFIASVLHSKLNAEGIKISENPTAGITPPKINYLASTPLLIVDLISKINKRSDNFLAECLFKTIGASKGQKYNNSFYATRTVLEFITRHNLYDKGVSIVDGSGISRFNEVTVKTLSDLLTGMYNKPRFFEIYKNSLSIAGVEGTLRRRLDDELKNKFWGKTGTLDGVTSISGYLETKKQEYYVVSMVFQFKEKSRFFYKEIQDKVIQLVQEQY